MTDQKQKPLYRLKCARITGRDNRGKEKLGNFVTIGAIWPISDGKKWHPVSLDVTPHELTGGNAVLFLQPVDQGGAQ